MKKIEKFFLWCSSTDQRILDASRIDPKSKQFQINYGRLILIPTIMAGLGVVHAVSDLIDSRLICIMGGLLMGWFVFSIDRCIMTTYCKWAKWSNLHFLGRLVLSIIMGALISLFAMLFFFQNRIEKQIKDEQSQKIEIIKEKWEKQIDSLNLYKQDLHEDDMFFTELLQAELDGRRITVEYKGRTYSTTGQRGRSVSAEARAKTLEELKIKNENERSNAERKIRACENKMAEEIALVRQPEAQDTLVQLEKLWEVINEHPISVLLIVTFYLLLLSLDVMPIIIKWASRPTQYDRLFHKEIDMAFDYSSQRPKVQQSFDNIDEVFSTQNQSFGWKQILVWFIPKKKDLIVQSVAGSILTLIYNYYYNQPPSSYQSLICALSSNLIAVILVNMLPRLKFKKNRKNNSK